MLDRDDKPPVAGETSPGVVIERPEPTENINPAQLTVEEVQAYKNCMSNLVFTAGVPYATLLHILTNLRAKPEMQQAAARSQVIIKRTLFFCGNMLIGTFLCAPFCYQKLREMRSQLEKAKKLEVMDIPPSERVQPTKVPDDYTYHTDLTSAYNEAESTFSTDFSTSLVSEKEEPLKSTPSTTYKDLQSRHRSSFGRTLRQPSTSQMPSDSLETPVSREPVQKEPQRTVKTNKYGDEIE